MISRNELAIHKESMMQALTAKGFDASMFEQSDAAACFYAVIEQILADREQVLADWQQYDGERDQ